MNRKRNIVIVTQQFGSISSGVGTYANILVKELLDKSYRITLICPEDSSGTNTISQLNIIRVTRPKIRSAARWIPLAFSFATALKKYLKTETPDLIYFIDAREAAFIKTDIPMIGTIHDGYAASCPVNPFKMKVHYADWFQRWGYYHLTAYLEARAFKRFSGLHYVCDFTRQQIENRHHVHSPMSWTLHLGLDINRFPPIDEIQPVSSRITGKILTVGGNPERKGVHNLVRALPAVLKKIPDAHLYIAGGNEHPAISRTARELGVHEAVTWLGWQNPEQLKVHYENASVFAMPSLVESLALVYLEAAIYGTPVLATGNCGLIELFGPDAALYCNPTHLEHISDGLIKLMSNPEPGQQMVDSAMPIVRGRDISQVAQEVGNMFEEVLSGTNG